jgi:hypothetical protein
MGSGSSSSDLCWCCEMCLCPLLLTSHIEIQVKLIVQIRVSSVSTQDFKHDSSNTIAEHIWYK